MKITHISLIAGIATTVEKDANGNTISITKESVLNVARARLCKSRPDDVSPERWAAMQKWLALNKASHDRMIRD